MSPDHDPPRHPPGGGSLGDRALAEVLEDRRRGASEIEARLLEVLLARLEETVDERGLGGLLEELTKGVLEHQPAMANLLGLVNESWLAVEGVEGEETGTTTQKQLGWGTTQGGPRERVRTVWQRRWGTGAGGAGSVGGGREGGLEGVFRRQVRGWIEEGPAADDREPGRLTVYTFSRSGSVLRVLRGLAAAGERFRVRVGEGRPGREGADLARDLAEGGVPEVRLAPDLVLAAELAGTISAAAGPALLLLGADAVGPEEWLNKVGSGALVLAARQRGVPVWVVAETGKVVPSILFRHLESPVLEGRAVEDPAGEPLSEPPSELQPEPPPLFERLPLRWVDRLLTEEGVWTPRRVAGRASGPVAEPLARRLEARSPGGPSSG